MREDYLEAVEKMFPKGWALVHIAPNNEVHLTWDNEALKNETLVRAVQALIQFATDEEKQKYGL